MRPKLLASIAAVAALAAPRPGLAQGVPPSQWTHGTTLEVLAGDAAAPSADARATLGCAIGWEIKRWLSVEGSGAWLVQRQGDEAFAAELKAVTSLTQSGKAVPYVAAGIGLYRATFDETGPIPDFYARRLVESTLGSRSTFTDPSFVFAGGVNIFTGRHLSIRPDLSVRLVTANSDAYAVTIAAVHVVYHFEVHESAARRPSGDQ